MSMAEAIERFVPDGASVALGTAQETLIPFAAGQEIIRQGKRDLILIGPISDMLFDQMIGAGCVSKVQAAWVGNVITGSSYLFREAVESGALEVEDYSNLALTMALLAGAMGVPFMPLRSTLGSSLYDTNPALDTIECPYTGETLATVAALKPDVTIVHGQRADANGNAHLWGSLGVTKQAAQAAETVILTVEEIVEREVISSDPNRTVIPGFLVSAVVEAPLGCHPSASPGYYNRDHDTFLEYRDRTVQPGGYDEWLAEWVTGVDGLEGYRAKLGEERLESLRVKQPAPSVTADFGY
jgi:glutaconate CoA-transferase subunit A